MNRATEPTGPAAPSPTDIAEQTSLWIVGAGLVTMALFPLALPIIALTAIAVAPLVLIPLAAGLVVAAVAAPILLARGVGRWAIRALRPMPTAERDAS